MHGHGVHAMRRQQCIHMVDREALVEIARRVWVKGSHGPIDRFDPRIVRQHRHIGIEGRRTHQRTRKPAKHHHLIRFAIDDRMAIAQRDGFVVEVRSQHDAVLIAAAFCMFNRYVDGLGTWSPQPKEAYKEVGEMLALKGYLDAIPA